MEIKLHQFLILELEEGNRSTPSSGHFSTEERAFGIIGREMCINLFIKVKLNFEI
jgi:molecular chaperone DnaK (HSP70)